jgi:hypothetical protein
MHFDDMRIVTSEFPQQSIGVDNFDEKARCRYGCIFSDNRMILKKSARQLDYELHFSRLHPQEDVLVTFVFFPKPVQRRFFFGTIMF